MLRRSTPAATTLIVLATVLALLVPTSGSAVVATPVEPTPSGAAQPRTSVGGKVIAARTLGRKGGAVKAGNGVSITVPKGVMRFRGRVEIRHLGHKLYDFHIYARWRGHVTVRLPKVMGRPLIMHNVEGKWVTERAKSVGPRFAVARVSRLSAFTNLLGCLKALKPSPGAAVSVAKCLVNFGIRKLPEWIAKKIVGYFNDYDACDPISLTNWTIDLIELMLASCTLSAPECEYSGTCGTTDPATLPSPTPTPTSTSSPSPSPTQPAPTSGNPPFTGGYFIQDAYLGGTWPRTDPWNGTWYGRSTRPANAADYWWANGLGVGFTCGSYAASYGVRMSDGTTQTWNTWLRSTDTWGGRVVGLWVPSAVARGMNVNGIPPGMPRC